MRLAALAFLALAACRSDGNAALNDAGDAGTCTTVVPRTEGGACPISPPDGLLCDYAEAPSGFCGARDCPSQGCCTQVIPGETCFGSCGECSPGLCFTQGPCTTASDCQGTLPHVCQSCALDTNGQGSQGCAHWICGAGLCQVAYCKPGLVCPDGSGCPSYYLPAVDRACGTAADCALVHHQDGCLTVASAVRVGAEAQFAAVEGQCLSLQFPCQSDGRPPPTLDDGTSPGPGQTIVASCVAGSCTAVISGQLVQRCGTGFCDAGEACCISPGDAGCVQWCAATCPLDVSDAGSIPACRAG